MLHIENGQQIHSLFMSLSFSFPVAWQAQYTGQCIIFDLIVQTDFYIVFNTQRLKQANILESSGNSSLVYLNSIHAGSVVAVQQNGPARRLVYLGEQVKDCRLT